VTALFEEMMCIVQGHYGEVLKGRYTDENGRVQDVAIKRLKQSMYEKFAKFEFEKEFTIMKQLQHPNIVCIIGQSLERKTDVSSTASAIWCRRVCLLAGVVKLGQRRHDPVYVT